MKPLRRITVGAALPEALAPLRVLASNLHSTWDPHAQASTGDATNFSLVGVSNPVARMRRTDE